MGVAAAVVACTRPARRTRSTLTATFIRTQKVCQLTGDTDVGTAGIAGRATGMVRGGGSRGITGTDIGWSFEHGGWLHFMFGDTRDFDRNRCDPGACGVLNLHVPVSPPELADWTDYTNSNPQDLSSPVMYWDWLDTHGDSAESWASVPIGADPSTCLALQVATDGTGNHRPTLLNGRTLPRQEGFFSGFSDGTNILAFVTRKSWPNGCDLAAGCAHDDLDRPGGKAALTLSRDGGISFDEIVHFSTTKFQFVAPNVVTGGLFPYPQLPAGLSGSVLFAFGAGRLMVDDTHMTKWNSSYPYLAVSDVTKVTNKTPTVNGVTAFVHQVGWNPATIGDPIGLTGPAIGLAPEDKRILPYNDKALVVRSDGYVWYQTIGLKGVGPYQFLPPRSQNGHTALVAVNSGDKWVVPDPARNRLLVITAEGNVWAHTVSDHIELPFQLATRAPVAGRPEDNWVLVVRDRLVVITKRGLVYGHPFTGTNGNTVGIATMLSDPNDPDTFVAGTTPPNTPSERWVFALGDNIMTVTGKGAVYSHPIAPVHIDGQPDVGHWQWFDGYQHVGWSDQDRWLLPIQPVSGNPLLLDITYKPTSFSYFNGLDGNGQPRWTNDESAAQPLWGDTHQCVGYYSVRYLQPVNTWLALYTCAINDVVTRGIYLRTAAKPWGPWSAPVAVMMVPGTENPYCNYMHLRSGPRDRRRRCPRGAPNPFDDEKRESQGTEHAGMRNDGGEYAPFLLPSSYHKYSAGGRTTLYFTLSTWNPYQTVLMATDATLR